MKKMLKRLLCWFWFMEHKWGYWGMAVCGDVVTFEKCSRCGLYKNDGKKRLKDWIKRGDKTKGMGPELTVHLDSDGKE